MITLKDIRYVRLGTSSLDEAVRYATRILGLELVRRDRNNAYLRSDDRDHTLAYTLGNPPRRMRAALGGWHGHFR